MVKAARRPLIATLLLAAALHGLGVARALLPAQDGLKFVRIARAFQTRPWADVVRDSDQHPLYPALVALAEPAVSAVTGRGPDAWRVSAQLVAALASVALLIPLHGLSRALFGPRVADLAALGFVLLPLPMAVGHDTLSDSLALAAFLAALRLGLEALRGTSWKPSIACGLAAGLGFLARPEVLVAPLAVVAAGIPKRSVGTREVPARAAAPALAGVAVAFLAVVGVYALIKGEVSEKLALRQGAALGATSRVQVRKAGQWLPPGLDDPRWDFSPKEEPADVVRRSATEVGSDLTFQWAEGLGWVLVFFAVWGLARDGFIRRMIADGGERPDPENTGRRLVASYLVLFTLVLARHEMRMGYLSHRHVLTLVVVSLPWAAAGVYVCARRASAALRLGPRTARLAGVLIFAAALTTSVALLSKPAHPSRWGHWAAGRWLAGHAGPGDAVLDTRGWAAFVSARPRYDYWHVRQALTDAHLAYVVVGDDELSAPSRRAATLRALLAYAAEPAATFPATKGGHDVGVRVYRFRRPDSWEGLRP
jgi:4-amino-4-deoxy-L-arabinose transferase-like glycosyltransferase